MILGLAVAVMSFTVQAGSQVVAEEAVVEDVQDTSDSQDVDIIKVDQPIVISNVSGITLVHEWYVLREVLLPEKIEKRTVEVVDRFTSELFRTLFQRIISPNAP